MTLLHEATFPSRRTFVLKLRSDATPAALVGRLENVVTGRQLAFESAHALMRSLEDEIATMGSGTSTVGDAT